LLVREEVSMSDGRGLGESPVDKLFSKLCLGIFTHRDCCPYHVPFLYPLA
jgi:hypothetical protein